MLAAARDFLSDSPEASFSTRSFTGGAVWMHSQLRQLNPAQARPFPQAVNFERAGLLKYGVSLIGALAAAMFLGRLSLWLLPLSAVVFYAIEVHFLFLFPLLLDGVKKPLVASVRATYTIGLFRAVSTVMLIAAYMLSGLLNVKSPLTKWYVGCAAILIWYNNEVRNRV